jgi:hypothetical protein
MLSHVRLQAAGGQDPVEGRSSRHLARAIAKAQEQFHEAIKEFFGPNYIAGNLDFSAMADLMRILEESTDSGDNQLGLQTQLTQPILSYLEKQGPEIVAMRKSIGKDYVVTWFIRVILPLKDFLTDSRVHLR